MTAEQAKTIRDAFDHISRYLLEMNFKLSQKQEMDSLFAAAQLVRDAVVAHTDEALKPAPNGSPGVHDLSGRPGKVEALPELAPSPKR